VKEQLLKLRERLEALSERERGMALLVVIVLLYTMLDALLLTPLLAEQKALLVKEQQANQQLEMVSLALIAMAERQIQDPDRETRVRIDAAKAEIGHIDTALFEFSKQLIPPREMTHMLERVLKDEKGLKLISAESMRPTALMTGQPGKEESAEGVVQSTMGGIYRHGLRLEIEGGYMQTLAYLRKLEQMPWKIYWDSVEYKVNRYPVARATITVNTLSFNENWIGM